MEELVGEIWDEYDEVSAEIEKKSENEYIVLGNAIFLFGGINNAGRITSEISLSA